MPRPFIAYHPSSPGYYTTTNTNISPSTEKFLVGFFITVIVLLIFLICSCVRFVSRAGRQVGGITAATVTAAASVDATNNSKVVLTCLPIFVYNSTSHQGNRECAVCLEDFTKGEHCRFLPECSHSFHLECIDMWLHSHSTCPLCRAPLEGQNTKLPV